MTCRHAAFAMLLAACSSHSHAAPDDAVSDAVTMQPDSGATISGTAYYVACTGNDAAAGTSPETAWQTIAKANAAVLAPGDGLLFERGCTFSGELVAAWTGTASAPIVIDAYGSGSPPVIANDAQGTSTSFVGVTVSGAYQVIGNLAVTVTNPARDAACLQSDGQGVPLGWYVGFEVTGHDNTLSTVEGYALALGVQLDDDSASNHIVGGYFHDLDMLWRVDATAGALGALGVNLHGTANEVAYSRFERNEASCTLGDGTPQEYSAPFEVYNANQCFVHHNRAYGHRKHFEMGHDSTHTTADNVLAFNLFASDHARAVGPNIHGTAPYGPVDRTVIYRNTIVLTGDTSQAIVCGCAGGATVSGNLLIAEWKAGYFDGNVVEDHDVFWDLQRTSDTSADPFVQFTSASSQTTPGTSSQLADPRLVDPGLPGDYRVIAGSPAIDSGTALGSTDPIVVGAIGRDLAGISVPQGLSPDVGSYEQ